jgi:hypothetical protein
MEQEKTERSISLPKPINGVNTLMISDMTH